MPKQASIITIAKLNNGHYSVDARGAFGGGFTMPTDEDGLEGAIITAWQRYGSNPLGCEIIGAPDKLKEIIARLTVSREEGDSVIFIRLPKYEADQIRLAATSENRSVNQYCRLVLIKASADIAKLENIEA
jgi:hypothetical protein